MNSLLRKLIAVLLVIILVSANLIILGEYTIAYAVDDDELNKQNAQTNNRNVLFNSYFDGETHSKIFDINSEEAKIYLRLEVRTSGYVENGTIEFQNVNFRIKEGTQNENIQSLDANNNKVVLDRVNNGSKIEVELPIEILNEDNVSLDNFNKEFIAKFTGTYIDGDGNKRPIEKEIRNKLSWKGTAEAELKADNTKYIPYALNEEYGVIAQTRINTSVKDSSLPIKNTNIEITAPEFNGMKPTDVTVIAKSMSATNGKDEGVDFTNQNYNYNPETGKIVINVNNLEGTISWRKNVQDEYLVTYIYEGKEIYDYAKENSIDVVVNVNAKLTLYNNEEIIAQKNVESKIQYNEQTGAITDFSMEIPENLSKGFLYANYGAKSKKETEYNTNYIATINTIKTVSSVEFRQGIDAFVTKESAEGNTTFSGKNYAYNKRVEIRQDIFNKMLGEEGSIVIKNKDNKEIGKITKETTLENGKYVVDISKEDTNQIIITTSAPITEGQIEINIVKALKEEIDYSKDQMKTFEKLKTKLEGHTDTTTYNVEKEMNLKEPETKIDLEISKQELTTVVPNENIEFRAVLDTSNVYNALYKDPTIKITLPFDIKNITLKGTNILLDNGLKIKSSEIKEENENKVIEVILEGNQTDYTINAEYKGAIIVINTDIILDSLTPSGTEKITMEYTNSNDVATNNEGIKEKNINIVAPVGVVAATGISNYQENAGEVQSISGEPQTVTIDANSEAKVATIEGAVVNNYKNDISDLQILGRIPAQGNKEIDSDKDLGSTFTIPLATGIGTSGLEASDYKVYYSDNENANNNLQDSSNGWKEEATTASKSYLMVFDEDYKMKSGDKFEFSYDINIPEDVSMNNSTYSMYKVYYNNEAEIGTIAENKTSAVMGMSTGTGAELKVELSSTEETVKEGQYVKMKVNITNTGETDATGVKVNITAPKYVTLLDYESANGFYEQLDGKFEIEVGDIKAGESAQTSYFIKMDENTNSIDPGILEGDLSEEEAEDILEEITFPKEVINKVTVTANELTGEIESNECKLSLEEGKLSVSLASRLDETQVLRKDIEDIYVVWLYNASGNETVNNTVVKLKIPDGFKFTTGEIIYGSESTGVTEGFSYDENSNTVTVNVGTLADQVRVNISVKAEKDIDGVVSVKAIATGDGLEEHYSNVLEFQAEKVNLSLSELTSTPKYIKEAQDVTYKFSITNNGKATVRQVAIKDELPEGLTYVSSTYTSGEESFSTGTLSGNNLTMSIANIRAGQTIEIQIMAKAQVLPNRDDKEIKNKATITAAGMNQIETNTVTNYIEYYEGAHENGDVTDVGGGSSGGNTSSGENRYKITGLAWLDSNADGKRDSSEQLLSGVQVILLNKEGNSVIKDVNTDEEKMATTSSNGTYEFNNLPNGEYLVVFAYDSSNYSLTEYQKDGVDTSSNSDAIDMNITLNGERRIVGITDTLTVNGENVRDIDIGLYTASKFDLRLDKYIDKISLTTPTIGTRVDEYNNSELGKVEVLGQNLGKSNAVVEYKIVVTNEGSVPGYVNKIVDYLPEKVDFNTELNTDWYLSENGNIYNSSLADQIINPGESKEVKLIVSVKITEDLLGTITNNAEIYESYNELGLEDIDSSIANKIETEDDMGKADVIFSLVTGKIVMYTSIAFVVIALIGFGVFEIKKHVLNKKI